MVDSTKHDRLARDLLPVDGGRDVGHWRLDGVATPVELLALDPGPPPQ